MENPQFTTATFLGWKNVRVVPFLVSTCTDGLTIALGKAIAVMATDAVRI